MKQKEHRHKMMRRQRWMLTVGCCISRNHVSGGNGCGGNS